MKRRHCLSRLKLQVIMKCLCSREMLKTDNMDRSSDSKATRDLSAGGCSSLTGEGLQKIDTGNIEEAESSLREGGCLNYEEARALLGRLEYQRGNTEAALRVFDGIDITAIVPKMKISLARRADRRKTHPHSYSSVPMSMHAISLLFEAIFLKAKSLQDLGRFKEAAQSCNVILDTVESALPGGLPDNFGSDCKLQEVISKSVQLLPELWKLAGYSHEAISSYRRALVSRWNLDPETMTKVQKEFAVFLLYGGSDLSPPNFRCQVEGSFIPRNNTEEAVLLLMILLRKFALKKAPWDASVLEHLTFALSVSGGLKALASRIEELLPGVIERKERYYTLALCYMGEGDNMVALNLLKKILGTREDPTCVKALLLASKICSSSNTNAEEGISFARKALISLHTTCDLIDSVANCLLGISLSAKARSSASDSEKIARQVEALQALETAEKLSKNKDYNIMYNLSLENADQRKLDVALYYAKQLVKLEAGSNIETWLLLVRILSAQKRFIDAETITNAALQQTGTWSQGELLRVKAKLQFAQGQLRNASETYTHILALVQLRNKSAGLGAKFFKDCKHYRSLEIETWHDLTNVYISMSLWNDAEVCISKLRAISPISSSRWYITGKFYEAKGLYREALGAYKNALEIESDHVPSLVSASTVLKQLGDQSFAIMRSYLTESLQLDRTNHIAWYNLGLLYKAKHDDKSAVEALECFQAAALLEETAPVEPFR